MTLSRQVFEKPITCQVTVLGGDVSVLLYGGHRSHIGAVSLAGPGVETVTHSFPGHKEQHITGPWAEKLAKKTGKNVCVQAGIHYEEATGEIIREILVQTDAMLEELLSKIA